MCALLGGEEEAGGGVTCACSVYSRPLYLCCLFTLRGSGDNRVLCRILLLSPRCNQTSRPRLVLAALPQRRCAPFLWPRNCFQSLNFDRCSATIFFNSFIVLYKKRSELRRSFKHQILPGSFFWVQFQHQRDYKIVPGLK